VLARDDRLPGGDRPGYAILQSRPASTGRARSPHPPFTRIEGQMAKRYEQVVRLSVDLRGVEPTVRRRFEVPAEMTLADLHRVLQVTFQWDDGHLHSFRAGEKR
jgi:hypothetical protein